MSGVASEFWTAENLCATLAGAWMAPPESPPRVQGGAAIDTRTLAPGEVFFALRGERVDGHRFLAEAFEAGAALAVIDDPAAAGAPPRDLPVLVVPDARSALARLAGAYRRRLSGTRFIAVTGSNGKTTTTRMIDACLSPSMRGSCSRKSFNNDLGVPLTILAAHPADRYVVCEVGANAPGEILPLSAIIEPDIVAITAIGRAHLEGFGSLEGVAREKLSLSAHMTPTGLLIHTADSPVLAGELRPGLPTLSFGRSEHADLRVGDVRQDERGITFSLNGRAEFSLPLLGEHNAMNAACAVAVARRMGLEDGAIARGLAGVRGPEMRLARSTVGGIELINDAYNANPDSMLAALRTLAGAARPGSRRVAVLGDMLEMGPGGPSAHREIGHACAEQRHADLLVLVGPLAREMAPPLALATPPVEHHCVDSLEGDGADRVAGLLRAGDTVLLKGSRGVRLERVAEAIDRRRSEPSLSGRSA